MQENFDSVGYARIERCWWSNGLQIHKETFHDEDARLRHENQSTFVQFAGPSDRQRIKVVICETVRYGDAAQKYGHQIAL